MPEPSRDAMTPGDEAPTQVHRESPRPSGRAAPAGEPPTQVASGAPDPWGEPPTLFEPGNLPGPGPDEPPTLVYHGPPDAGGPTGSAEWPTEVASAPGDPAPAADPAPSAGDDPPPAVGPVDASERIAAVDLVRGFALCGILAMNITSFGLPTAAYENPAVTGDFAGPNVAAWLVNHLVFEDKMMTLFSMLFGAGLVLMTGRAEARGRSPTAIYYRRVLWLLAIGLAHGFLVWVGDILVTYAACGLVLYWFRRLSPRALAALGAVALLIPIPIGLGLGSVLEESREAHARVRALEADGQRPTDEDREAAEAWAEMQPIFQPTPEQLGEEIAIYRGGYGGILRHRAPEVFMIDTVFLLLFSVWSVGGRMLLGMALMKWGVFSAARSPRFYAGLALAGYGLGLPLVAYSAHRLWSGGFDPIAGLRGVGLYNEFGSILVALGHVGLLISAYLAGVASGLTRRLSAVGRMALTNYLTHSLTCTTLFYGYGFGLFARLERWQLAFVVAAIWVVQLWYSPIWLRHFRFGPAEWAWRSLTYWSPQPLRRADAAA